MATAASPAALALAAKDPIFAAELAGVQNAPAQTSTPAQQATTELTTVAANEAAAGQPDSLTVGQQAIAAGAPVTAGVNAPTGSAGYGNLSPPTAANPQPTPILNTASSGSGASGAAPTVPTVVPTTSTSSGSGTASAIDPTMAALIGALEGGSSGDQPAQATLAPSTILPTDSGTSSGSGTSGGMSTTEVLVLGIIGSLIAAAIWFFIVKKKNLKDLGTDLKEHI